MFLSINFAPLVKLFSSLFRVVSSPDVSMMVLVCLTTKNKHFHAPANRRGLGTDLK